MIRKGRQNSELSIRLSPAIGLNRLPANIRFQTRIQSRAKTHSLPKNFGEFLLESPMANTDPINCAGIGFGEYVNTAPTWVQASPRPDPDLSGHNPPKFYFLRLTPSGSPEASHVQSERVLVGGPVGFGVRGLAGGLAVGVKPGSPAAIGFKAVDGTVFETSSARMG